MELISAIVYLLGKESISSGDRFVGSDVPMLENISYAAGSADNLQCKIMSV